MARTVPRAVRRHLPAVVVVLVAGLAGAMTASATIGAAAPAAAPRSAVEAVDTEGLLPLYQGRILSRAELDALVQVGRAQVAITSPDLTCRGVVLYVDTQAQADAYSATAERTSCATDPAATPVR